MSNPSLRTIAGATIHPLSQEIMNEGGLNVLYLGILLFSDNNMNMDWIRDFVDFDEPLGFGKGPRLHVDLYIEDPTNKAQLV